MRVFTIAALVWTVLAGYASAAERYVSTLGSDASNDCSMPTGPCRTISHALDESASGDVLHLAGGSYAESNSRTNFGAITIDGGWDEAFAAQSTTTPTLLRGVQERVFAFYYDGSNTGSVTLSELTLHKTTQRQPGPGEYVLGGGLLVDASGSSNVSVSLDRMVFEKNRGPGAGGAGLRAGDDAVMTASVTNSRFAKNKGRCGGLRVETVETALPSLVIADTVFEKNTGSDGGLCIRYYNNNDYVASVQLDRVAFLRNKGTELVGAMLVALFSGEVSMTLTNSVFLGNTGILTGGLYLVQANFGGTPSVDMVATNNTFSGNKSKNAGRGAGISIDSRTQITYHSKNEIISGNKPADVEVSAFFGGAATLERTYGIHGLTSPLSNAQITDGPGILAVDPEFASRSDVHLSPTSPAIDAGDCVDAPTEDFDGDSRPNNGQCDIGADEFVF